MFKCDKVLRLKRQDGRPIQVVREHYMREDVPCYSELCLAACSNITKSGLSVLPGDLTHYVMPDCRTALEYLELLEISEFTGIIFLHTVLRSVQNDGSQKLYRKLQNMIHTPSKQSVVFYNEFQKYAYIPRAAGQSLTVWQNRSVHKAAEWYYDHLAGQKPIIVLTPDPQIVEEYGSRKAGVLVLTIERYLQEFWPDLTAAHDLYKTLAAMQQQTTNVSSKDQGYQTYLPKEVVDSGLKSGQYIQGFLHVNKHNAMHEAFLRPTGVGSKDSLMSGEVLVHGSASRNRAVHGDIVVVELLPRKLWRSRSHALTENESDAQEEKDSEGTDLNILPTGHVVAVLQRNWRDYVATFSQDIESGSGTRADRKLAIPFDWRVPKIRISTRNVDTLKDKRFIVRIDSWEVGSQYPNGHLVRVLGPVGSLETEIETLLLEHGLSVPPFTQAQLAEMPVDTEEKPWQMSAEEITRRRDLRDSHLIFSIDPKGCEDVDDTLSVRKLENGHLELGVHIADVSYFVAPRSLTDIEASQRGTTVYLADRRYDMLPEVLSANLCSLISQVDRYAMSVIWELNTQYEVVDVWYGRSVIRSSYKLFYEMAQQMADGADTQTLVENIPELQNLEEDVLVKRMNELRWAVSTLMEVARGIRQKRVVGGALELEGVEVQVQVDDTKNIEDLIPKQPLEIHETIAECMIFANHWVAKKICETFPNAALLRHHPLPRQEQFETLAQCAKSLGFDVKTTSSKDLTDSLDRCVDPGDPNVNKILRTLATQAMSNAAYFSTGSIPRDQFFHYGLALDYYTHYTSPIRRYADIVVHRLLLAAIGVEDQDTLLSNKELQNICEHINRKHRSSQNAQRDSVELFQAMFFRSHADDDDICLADAIIFQIKTNGVLVLIPRYGVKSAVYLRNKSGLVAYVQDSHASWEAGTLAVTDTSVTVNSLQGSQTYKLFDHITVRVNVQSSHIHSSGLKLDLVSNQPHSSAELTTGSKDQRAQLIKDVQDKDARKQQSEDLVQLGADFVRWKAEYEQTPEDLSFYNLLLSLSDMAKMDV